MSACTQSDRMRIALTQQSADVIGLAKKVSRYQPGDARAARLLSMLAKAKGEVATQRSILATHESECEVCGVA